MFLVSCLFDAAAIVLMVWLLVVLARRSEGKTDGVMYFRNLPMTVIAMSIADALVSLVMIYVSGITAGSIHEQFMAETGYTLTAMIICIADINISALFLFFWVYFLCWHLFHDKGYIRRKFRIGISALVVSGIVMIAAIIMLVVAGMADESYMMSYCVYAAARVFYFAITLKFLFEYKAQNGTPRFFIVWAFFLPVVAGWILQEFTGLNLRAFGSAIGVILLYLSADGKRRSLDAETGLYNTHYIDYLKKLIAKGQFDPCSAIIFEKADKEKIKDFAATIKKAVPDHCEPIRCTDERVVVLTGVKKTGPLEMVLEDVRSSTGVEGNYILIQKDETSGEFMERVL